MTRDAKELLARYGIRPHATTRLAHGYIGFGVVVLGVGLWAGSFFAMLGPIAIGLGIWIRRRGHAAQVVNRALHESTAGRTADAEALLDYAETQRQGPIIRRVIDIQRAAIALRCGRLEDAYERAKAAVERPLGWATRGYDRQQIVHARAIFGFTAVSLDRRDEATEAIEAVRESVDAAPDAHARAELAAALLLERAGEREALREHLDAHRHLLLNYTRPRERAIVRAYERMLQAKGQSVYRKPAAIEGSDEELPLEAWVKRLAPGAAPFVRTSSTDTEPPAERSSENEQSAEAKKEARKRVDFVARKGDHNPWQRRLFGVFMLLVVGTVLAWFLLEPGGPPNVERDVNAILDVIPIVFAGFAALFVGLIVYHLVRIQRDRRRLIGAMVAVARGEHERGATLLEPLSSSSVGMIAGQAHGALAGIAFRHARVQEALEHVNAALGKLSMQRAAASDWVYPNLLSQRAALLAALGRLDEARAEIAVVEETYTSYPFFGGAQATVALMEAANTGDVEAAAKLADRVVDLPLGAREELLLDLARAAVSPGSAGAGELERLKATLKRDDDMRTWADEIAPAFIPAFEKATHIPA